MNKKSKGSTHTNPLNDSCYQLIKLTTKANRHMRFEIVSRDSLHSYSFMTRMDPSFQLVVAWRQARKVASLWKNSWNQKEANILAPFFAASIHSRQLKVFFLWKTVCKITFLAVLLVLFLWKVVNSLFEIGQGYISDFVAVQVKSSVKENRAYSLIYSFLDKSN